MAERLFTKKAAPRRDICLIIENGIPCLRPVASRGLCTAHRSYLSKIGKLEAFALPASARKHALSPNPSPKEGICRVVESGVPCEAAGVRRGLCVRHYQAIWQRDDLRLEDFVLDRRSVRYKRQKHPREGRCLVREVWPDGRTIDCDDTVKSLGLCGRHRHVLDAHPESIGHLVERVKGHRELRLKSHIREGFCVVVDNGEGCTRPATTRRQVCMNHYHALRKSGQLHEFTDQFLRPKLALGLKPEDQRIAGYCRMTVNGTPCLNKPGTLGICNTCHARIRRAGADIALFAAPCEKPKERSLERKPHPVNGMCVVIEGGVPCDQPMYGRGLCKKHYRMAAKRGTMTDLAMSKTELAQLPNIQHYYFDKNVLIKFAFHELFGVSSEQSSVAIVKAVLDRRIRATVSLDCVRAVYSHVGHRLARPLTEGGKDMLPAEAEVAARKYTQELFFRRGGFWNLLPYGKEQMETCMRAGAMPHLSLEDALEVALFGEARQKFGISLFVTADNHVLQHSHGVHPAHLAKDLGLA